MSSLIKLILTRFNLNILIILLMNNIIIPVEIPVLKNRLKY